MYGHIESSLHKAKHLELLRKIQTETHGFTEFVPLQLWTYRGTQFNHGVVRNVREGADDTR